MSSGSSSKCPVSDAVAMLQAQAKVSLASEIENNPLKQVDDQPICLDGHAWPDVYLIGMMKAGTTTLASDLFKAGLKSAIKRIKELHLFDKLCQYSPKRYWRNKIDSEFIPGCPNITNVSVRRSYPMCNTSAPHLADMTPVNMRLPGLPKLLSNLYGESQKHLKFIVAVRSPIHRFHSGYHHARRRKYWPASLQSFSAYVKMLRTSLADLVDSGNLSRSYKADQLYRSMYGSQLQTWLQTFSPNQFAIVPMGSYFTNLKARRDVIKQLAMHFGIGLNEQALKKLSHKNDHSYPSLEEDLDQEHRIWLDEVFRPDKDLFYTSIASGLKAGMLFPLYDGTHSAKEVAKFLNW